MFDKKLYGKNYHKKYIKKPGVREAKIKRSREWRINNLEKSRAQIKEWMKKNHSRVVELGKIYRKKNRVRENLLARKWRKLHPYHTKATMHRFRSQNPISPITIQLVYEDNIKWFGTLTCYLCLKQIAFGKDCLEHKTPFSRGGDNNYNNLSICHRKCNSMKASKTYEEFKMEKIK